jgi:hypothetical protein
MFIIADVVESGQSGCFIPADMRGRVPRHLDIKPKRKAFGLIIVNKLQSDLFNQSQICAVLLPRDTDEPSR